MSPVDPSLPLSLPADGNHRLLRQLLGLALPVLVEQILHMAVGLNDTYLANHLPADAAPAGAAVGTITYFLWFIGLLVGAIGTGSAAIIARAIGARHRSLANAVCGQSVSAAILIGLLVGALLYAFSAPLIALTGLIGPAPALAETYLRMLSVTLPFTSVMFIANSCQRGAGDTVTPAIVMVVVDVINILFTFALCRGWAGLPVMGFKGIAAGTIIAYVSGGVIQFIVLLRSGGAIRLFVHRLWPHWQTIKRLLRIGVPAGVEGLLSWVANFGVIRVINRLDATNVMSAAHINAIRIESCSFLVGFAFATGASTMVGQSLGMKDPRRAARATFLAYALGGGFMTLCGLFFIFFGRIPASWLSSNDPQVIELTRRCLFVTGFIQSGFAAYLIFSGALRGAGDTFVVMILSLASVILLRFVGVEIVGGRLGYGLQIIWIVLAGELFIRGAIAFSRFMHGGWKRIEI